MASYNSQPPPPPPEGRWTTGFHDCCQDRNFCVRTLFCPWSTLGEIAEIVTGGATPKDEACCRYSILPSGWKAMYAGRFRRQLRETFKLPEEPHGDCLVHECCCICALTQEYRELKNRGADPALGWEANLQKWSREGVKPPITPHQMTRC